MKLIEQTFCQTLDYFFNHGNGQPIREALLRQAVRSCENYATDIIIFFDSIQLRELIESDNGFITIYFRNMGVDWIADRAPEKYRYKMMLVKTGHKYELFGEMGNV